jgi:DNA-binding SARP family transcriptional activator
LLGNLRFLVNGQVLPAIGTNRLQSLLAFLVLHPDVPQSREHLAFFLWPESNGGQARTNLRQLLHHLRRALPAGYALMDAGNQTVCWRGGDLCAVDVFEFESAASRGIKAEKEGDFRSARAAFDAAALLYQDDLLPGLSEEWLQPMRDQLRLRFTEILSRLAALSEMDGEYPTAIRHVTKLLALDPLSEPSYQMLMRLHLRNGDRSSALRVYHQCMRTLRRELGVSPSKTTQELLSHALHSEPAALPAVTSPQQASTAPPLVGRTREWEGLLACWQRAMRGEAHLALISGEPGIGKSRLAEELFHYCARIPGAAVAQARCYFAQGTLAYAPIAEWLRKEPVAQSLAQLPRARLAELARVLPELLAEDPAIPAPAPLLESWQKLHLYEALNAGVGNAPKPLLLLIDDLQWCDPDSLEWLSFFFRSDASANTLVLGTVRAEETGRGHPLNGLLNELRQSGQVSEFSLMPLDAGESSELARQLTSRNPEPAFLESLYRFTKGNPLFVVESVRASMEDRRSVGVAPPRVQAVIASRLAQLSSPGYELAGVAAIVGRPFVPDLLARITDWDSDSLSRALEELVQRRIIGPQGGASYDFTHDLLREVAYAGLNPIRRRLWHQRVALAIERSHAPDLNTVSSWLAAHYEAAGMAEQAIHFYQSAASLAKQRFADAEAAGLMRRALRVCRDLPESARRDRREIELLVTLGPSLVFTLGYSVPEVGETYERGLALSRRSGDGTHLFSLLSGAWLFHIVRGDLEESRNLGQRCLDGPGSSGVPALEMAGCFLVGSSLFHLGRLHESRDHIERSVPPYGSHAHPALALFAGPDVGVFCRAYLSHLLWQLGEIGAAETNSQEAIALARELGHPFSLAIALSYAAMLDTFRCDAGSTLTRAGEASEVCRKHGFSYYAAWAEILTGWAVGIQGDAAGLAQLRGGIDSLKATGAEVRLPFYYALAAEVCGLLGQPGQALANIAAGFGFQTKNGEFWTAPELHRIQGDVFWKSGNAEEARASYLRSIESARLTGALSFERRAAARLDRLSTR